VLIAVKSKPIYDQRAVVNCVKAVLGKMQDALGALWVSCLSQWGRRGMGASQIFLVISQGPISES
jgi:hypothetical protein